jgi:hypothetical protein
VAKGEVNVSDREPTDDLRRTLEDMLARASAAQHLLTYPQYGNSGVGGLFPRLERAMGNQITGGPSTLSRYAIWAMTVRDTVAGVLEQIERQELESASKHLVEVANSLLAFAQIQDAIDEWEKWASLPLDTFQYSWLAVYDEGAQGFVDAGFLIRAPNDQVEFVVLLQSIPVVWDVVQAVRKANENGEGARVWEYFIERGAGGRSSFSEVQQVEARGIERAKDAIRKQVGKVQYGGDSDASEE